MTKAGGRSLLAATAVVAATGLLAAPCQAAFPGKNGLIAFERSVGEQSYVYTARSDGSRVRRLRCSKRDAKGQCLDGAPAWTPNGRRLAISNVDGIAIVDRNGKLIKQVATEGPPSAEPEFDSDFRDPVWSPSSKALAYTDHVGDDTEVYIVNVKTKKTRKLTHGPAEPAWSSRNRIALSGFDLTTVFPDGKKPRVVFSKGEVLSADWAPGGRQLVFTGDSRLRTIKANGKGLERLKIGKADPQDAKWSPNGKIIIWVDFRTRKPVLRALNRRTGRVRTILGKVLNPDWQSR